MNETILQRLLKYPHSPVFDKSPVAQLAFRLSHAGGADWKVADEVLTVTANGNQFTYPLANKTFLQLSAALTADGFTVLQLNSSLQGKAAILLAEGSGRELTSNGDHLYSFTSPLWALFSGYAAELREAKSNMQEALRQMILDQSGDIWLDLWGALLDQKRLSGEIDASFAPRIKQEAFRKRVNAYSIEKAVLDITGYVITIEQPWQNIFTLDESTLSGEDNLYDGGRTGYHLIRPRSIVGVDWSVILPVIERNRAAGIAVLPPETQIGDVIDASNGIVIVPTTIFSLHTASERYIDRARLDFSAIEDTAIVNESFYHQQQILHFGEAIVPIHTWAEMGSTWRHVPWSGAEYMGESTSIRGYRAFYSTVTYSSQPWQHKTWAQMSGIAWSDYNVLVEMVHSS